MLHIFLIIFLQRYIQVATKSTFVSNFSVKLILRRRLWEITNPNTLPNYVLSWNKAELNLISWTCLRTTETGSKFYPSSWKRYWTHCIGWTNVVGCSWQVWCCWKKCVKMYNFVLQQIINLILLLKFRCLGSFLSYYLPTLDNDTFAIISTQPSNMQGEHWIMFANFRQDLYFADSLGCKRYRFLNNKHQHYKQVIPASLQCHPSVCGFHTVFAAFHLLKFRQEEITGDHDVYVLYFLSNFFVLFHFLYVNVQFILCVCPILYILINFFKILQNLLLSIKSYQNPHA